MLVKYWMTADPVTVTPDTSVMKASQLMKENKVMHLPVVDEKGDLIGIVSDRDIKEASPSTATTLDAHELYYLLGKLEVKDIMRRKVMTIKPDETVEKAAVIMLKYKITGLPVVEGGKAVGILSQGDVFRVLTSITGIYQGGVQFALNLEDRPGSIKEVADVIRKHGGRMVSILTTYEMCDEGYRNVYIRIADMAKDKLNALVEELKGKFTVVQISKDQLSDI